MHPQRVEHPALNVERRADERHPAQHAVGPETLCQGVDVREAVEDRQDCRLRPYSGGELLHRLSQGIRLGRQQDQIEGSVQVVRRDGPGLHAEVAMRADHLQATSQLLGPLRAHQERHVAPGPGQARPEKSAQSTRADHQDPHADILSVRQSHIT